MSQQSGKNTVLSKNKVFELAEENPTHCYISIHENVYDVTEFLDEVIIKL